MKPPLFLIDTVARRFALTALLSVGTTLVLVLLFQSLSGVWGREPLERSGLLNEIGDMVRLIEAAPPDRRDSLTAAAFGKSRHMYWFAPSSAAARFLDSRKTATLDTARTVAADTDRQVVVVQPGSAEQAPPELTEHPGGALGYLLAVHLLDGSWVVFSAPHRIWGLSRWARWSVWVVFLAISIGLSTMIAARQFVRPIRDLAVAAREFGTNPQAPAILESGPRELRQVIHTFNNMQAQIQKFVSYRTMMLAAISHDLRTPLTRMRLRGELIEDSEQRQRLFRDVDEMQAMVDGALVFFRDDAVTEPTTTFDLSNVLLTIVNDFADQGIEICCEGPAGTVYRGRPFALKRAFTNLIENAIKYATPPRIELRSDQGLIVVIRDRGPGIPESALGNVFLPYYRVEKSRNRGTGGVGLGLTVAQAIVQAHGGEIVLMNAPDGGLEARVMLPRLTEPAFAPGG